MSSSDDPAVIQAFLSRIPPGEMVATTVDANIDAPESHGPTVDRRRTGISTPVTTEPVSNSSASTPSGVRAPPPTPEPKALSPKDVETLPSIDEDNQESSVLADASTLTTCVDSMSLSADAKSLRPLASPFSPNKTNFDRKYDPASDSVLELMRDESVASYQQDVLERTREQALARIAAQGQDVHEDLTGPNKILTQVSQNESDLVPSNLAIHRGEHANKSSSADTEPFPEVHDESAITCGTVDNGEPAESIKSSSSSEINIIVDVLSTPASYKSAVRTASQPQSSDNEGVSLKDVPDIETKDVAKDGQSRQHSTFFASWGQPSHRDGPASRVRKVVLTHLPPTADLNLVQSLIFGGAIEEMKLHHTSDGPAVAFVTFADGLACDEYYNHFPNGLEFKHKGRNWTVFVEKGQDVDVVSGIMKNYLECGASRVVKVIGADGDWSMRALHKIAAGDRENRKIEAIFDSYRDEARVIVFRFTNIADAVSFRSTLLRSSDWQDADVQFAVDPCEKATNVHFE